MTVITATAFRPVMGTGTNPANNELLWTADLHAMMLGLFMSGEVTVALAAPADTTKIWYQPSAANAANGSFFVYEGAAWVSMTSARYFTWLRTRAAYSPAAGGLTDGDMGDLTVSGGGTVLTIDNNVVDNAKAADMAAFTFKLNNSAVAADPQDVNVTALTADAAPALTKIITTFDPVTGEPMRTTLAQISAVLGTPTTVQSGADTTVITIGVPRARRTTTGLALTHRQLIGGKLKIAMSGPGYTGGLTAAISADGGATFTLGGLMELANGTSGGLAYSSVYELDINLVGGNLVITSPSGGANFSTPYVAASVLTIFPAVGTTAGQLASSAISYTPLLI